MRKLQISFEELKGSSLKVVIERTFSDLDSVIRNALPENAEKLRKVFVNGSMVSLDS